MIGENFCSPIEIGISFSSNEDDITQYGVHRVAGLCIEQPADQAHEVDKIMIARFPEK